MPALYQVFFLGAVQPQLALGNGAVGFGVDPLAFREVLDGVGDFGFLEQNTGQSTLANSPGMLLSNFADSWGRRLGPSAVENRLFSNQLCRRLIISLSVWRSQAGTLDLGIGCRFDVGAAVYTVCG
jgi:hypothetical protein